MLTEEVHCHLLESTILSFQLDITLLKYLWHFLKTVIMNFIYQQTGARSSVGTVLIISDNSKYRN